jgi:hypothetical protein
MGDPVTMAMIGAGVGAITNPKKPLQGALLGGALGGFGGAAMGAGNAAATATMTGASAVPAGAATTITPMTAGATFNPAAGGTIANFATPTMPTYAATGGSTGLIPSITATPTMMDRLRAVGQFGRENPMVGQVGFSALKDIMQPQPMAAPTPGLLRGTPSQEQPPQYAMAMPQVSLI